MRAFIRSVLGLAVLAATISSGAGTARACDCALPPAPVSLPRNGAMDVPTNVRVLVYAETVGASRWAAADATQPTPDLRIWQLKRSPRGDVLTGKAVKAAVSTMMSEIEGTFYVVRPEKPLASLKTYALVVVTGKKPTDRRVVSTFTTGSVADAAAPAFSGVEETLAFVDYQRRRQKCDNEAPFEQLFWKLGEAKDDMTKPEELIELVYVQKKGQPRQLRMVRQLPPGQREVRLTDTVCDPFHAAFKPGDEMCVSVELMDLAGNPAGGAVEKCSVAKAL